MKRQDISDAFRTEADDNRTPPLFSDDEVETYINEAQEEACIRTKLIFDRTDESICHIDINPSDLTYDISDKIHEIRFAQLVDADGAVSDLEIIDRDELDRRRPDWRIETDKPTAIVHEDKTIQIDCTADAAYTIQLEVYRLPKPLESEASVPEINAIHHRFLVDWVLYRAFSKPDADLYNPGKAQEAHDRFEKHFGERPDATMRKRDNANLPHRVKAYW
jgi:hypothetical protein